MLLCKVFATLLCAFGYLDFLMSLELEMVRVPTQVTLGIRAHLLCQWALGFTDVLYSVKWYKDGKEFFRYVPGQVEPIKKFLLPGVDVQEFSSTGSNLTLAPAVRATTGRYRCEVSGERPQFHTVSEYADLFVIVLSSHGLNIVGFKSQYHTGDLVNVTCSSDQEKLTMKLTWYINGEPALPTKVQPVYSAGKKTNTNLRIEFTVVESLAGKLKFQCLATIASTYWRSIERTATVSGTHVMKNGTALAHPTSAKSGCNRTKWQCSSTVPRLFLCFLYLFSSKIVF